MLRQTVRATCLHIVGQRLSHLTGSRAMQLVSVRGEKPGTLTSPEAPDREEKRQCFGCNVKVSLNSCKKLNSSR